MSLYNAVNKTSFTDPEEIQFTTIEDAIYMGMKNDLSFMLCYVMNIYEQQSTYSPNMPVRQLMYAGKLYDKYIQTNHLNIYGKKMVRLPIPKLVVFYNGKEKKEDTVLKLSDAFREESRTVEPDIEVRVRMLNINFGKNPEMMENCKPLKEYAWLVERIRKNRKKMDIEAAVDKAIDEMPGEFVIRQFLIGNRAEVKDMCITEYNEAETLQMIREEGREEGRTEGEDKLEKLMSLLISNQRTEDAQRAAVDKVIRDVLYKEFNII